MITSEEALEIVKKYLTKKTREFLAIREVFLEENKTVEHGKYIDTTRNIFIVPYEIEDYQVPIVHFVAVDAETGEVLFTSSPHGYVEEWEE
jgi:hypothetical protein